MAATTIITLIASPVVSIVVAKLNTLATTPVLAFFKVNEDVEKLKKDLIQIQQLHRVLETHQVYSSSSPELGFWTSWFANLRAAAYDAEDLIDSWTTEYNQWEMKKKVHNLCLPFCPCNFLFRHDGLKKLKEITATINKILTDGQGHKILLSEKSESSSQTRETGSVPDTLVYINREDSEKKIIQQLITDEEARDGKNFSLIPILGMGGLGKTTLAQVVFNDAKVIECFKIRIWVCVTNNFRMKTIFKNILVSLVLDPKARIDVNSLSFNQQQMSGINLDSLTLEQLETQIIEIMKGKRFLLVLDDLWNYTYEDLKPLVKALVAVGGKGNKVLVTSRLKEVSNSIGAIHPHNLQPLDDKESWSLFKKVAFKKDRAPKELETCGRAIVGNCKGLPLAVVQMGSLLRGKPIEDWKRIAERTQGLQMKDDNGVLNVLRLSYDHLPSTYHKQCFAYCALFPKGYVYEKDELIKLWMAEAFIQQPENGEKAEHIGRSYFKVLSDRFFFERSTEGKDESTKEEDEDEQTQDEDEDEQTQDEDEDELTQDKDERKYKMHDLIHDLAQLISSPFSCQVNDIEDFNEQCRHVSLLSKDVEPTFVTISRSHKLRTILFPVQHFKAFGKAQREILHSHMYMRVLDLSSSTLLTELPDSIGRLTLLHYLNLSRTEIKKLPDSICDLCNLETLKLLGCPWLFVLPRNLKNLVKLRYLELDEIFWSKALTFPQSIGCLTSLHDLHKFQVGWETGYNLEELKNMAYLRGTLHISKLENAVNAGDANLKGKRIQKVVYEWSNSEPSLQDENQVLKDLQPHPNVEELQICHYRGTGFPSWMRGDRQGKQLQHLVKICLNHCKRIKILSLGKLPNLRELHLKNMLELEKWQEGEEEDEDEGLRLLRTNLGFRPKDKNEEMYPFLQTLKISNCPKLTKFPFFFPRLRILKIKRCESLDTIPFGPVMFMTLADNPVLKHWTGPALGILSSPVMLILSIIIPGIIIYREMLNLKIINCPELQTLPIGLCPQQLKISGCSSLSDLPNQSHSARLQVLALDACHDETLVGRIPSTESLYSLVISNVSNLIRLPEWPSLPKLEALYIVDCRDLEYLSNHKNLFQGFTSLRTLSIRNCPKLLTMPDEGLPTALQYLSIKSCPRLKSFGPRDVLKKLNALSDLYIEDCPALQSLPEDGLPPSLLHLSIQQCPSLIEQCKQEGSDFPKIKDIPDREIDTPSAGTPISSSSAAWYLLPGSCGEFLGFCVGAIQQWIAGLFS